MKAFPPTPPCHHTPGELIDNHDLTIANDVINITLKQGVGTQRCIQMMHQTDVANIIETRSLVQQSCFEQHRFGAFVAVFSQKDLLVLLIDREITWALFFMLSHQFWDDVIDLHIQISTVVGRTRYDQWCSSFIDQDGVHFVYDGKITRTLNTIFAAECHVVAQIVKTILVVGAVNDIARVSASFRLRALPGYDHAHCQTQELVDLPHPVGITGCEIVVHRDDMDSPAADSSQIRRQGCNQSLALTRTHFCDLALVQHHATDQLHIKVPHVQGAPCRLTHNRKYFRHQIFRALSFARAPAKLIGLGCQTTIIKTGDLLFQRINPINHTAHSL